VTGEWRKLHNEELNDMYCSSNIVGEIKSLLSFGVDSFVIQKFKDKDVQNYNFACCFVWV